MKKKWEKEVNEKELEKKERKKLSGMTEKYMKKKKKI